ncbi:transglycosylase family protein [Kitasatospora viridis]|uniref:LysM domain-containing protein n=1 Tax=Kitasatospora viridis TaxID=281105 RepID=A0A561TTY5_9ACTN|nr:transglycosylase family protein [Kitasatospora viridis]TWF90568.1 LysM domain-containing protein [Kitasatospora viridis]
MTFRNENTATTAAATETPKKRNRVRMAVMGGVIAALPVAGLVTATTASAASTSTWNAVAQCESTGNWSINSGNGFYGGLQFTSSTWAAYGGTQYAPQANQATPAQQIAVAEKVLADQGPGAWPVCSVQAGLTAGGAPAQVDTSSSTTASNTSSTSNTSSSNNSTTNTPAPAAQQQTAPVQQQAQPAAPVQQAAPKAAPQTQGTAKQEHRKAKQAPTTGGYTVKSGDTLSAIAAANGTTVQSLYAKNASVIGGNPDLIMPGQVLSI